MKKSAWKETGKSIINVDTFTIKTSCKELVIGVILDDLNSIQCFII